MGERVVPSQSTLSTRNYNMGDGGCGYHYRAVHVCTQSEYICTWSIELDALYLQFSRIVSSAIPCTSKHLMFYFWVGNQQYTENKQ